MPAVSRTVEAILLGHDELPNLGLRHIVSFLAAQGHRAMVVPFSPGRPEVALQAIRKHQPVLVGFSVIFQYFLDKFADLVEHLRAAGVTAHFTAGGHYPSLRPEDTLRLVPGLDSVVRFEGEETTLELLSALVAGTDWRTVRGIAYRAPGGVRRSAPRPPLLDLDRLPWPDRSGDGTLPSIVHPVPILASRGCLLDCSFCSIREFYRESTGPARRIRSPADVVAEIRTLYERDGARVFWFLDDDFAMKSPAQRRWVNTFLDGLEGAGLAGRILWKASCRVDEMDPALLARCRDHGLLLVYLGVESGSDGELRTLNKRVTAAQNLAGLRVLRDAGLPYDMGFMLLEPDSSFARVRQNLAFLRAVDRMGGPLLTFARLLPLASTPIERRLAAEKRLTGDSARPDYRLLDQRLDYYSAFVTLAFSWRNSDPLGLVERFRVAYLAALVMERVRGERFDVEHRRSLDMLARRANASALDLLERTLDLVESLPDARSVAVAWPHLVALAQAEEHAWKRMVEELDQRVEEHRRRPWKDPRLAAGARIRARRAKGTAPRRVDRGSAAMRNQ